MADIENRPTTDKALSIKEAPAENTSIHEGELEFAILDEAEKFLQSHEYTHAQVDALLEGKVRTKRFIRKVDLAVLTFLCFTYVLQYR
jgi:hypothetical protein